MPNICSGYVQIEGETEVVRKLRDQVEAWQEAEDSKVLELTRGDEELNRAIVPYGEIDYEEDDDTASLSFCTEEAWAPHLDFILTWLLEYPDLDIGYSASESDTGVLYNPAGLLCSEGFLYIDMGQFEASQIKQGTDETENLLDLVEQEEAYDCFIDFGNINDWLAKYIEGPVELDGLEYKLVLSDDGVDGRVQSCAKLCGLAIELGAQEELGFSSLLGLRQAIWNLPMDSIEKLLSEELSLSALKRVMLTNV